MGKRGPKSILSAEQQIVIVSQFKGGKSAMDLAIEYKVTAPTIYRVINKAKEAADGNDGQTQSAGQ